MKNLLLLPCAAALLLAATPDGFVRVDSFEICDHPVTNTEYKHFVDATGARAPEHWKNGAIPAGLENHPVIFVNRYDVHDYLTWRSRQEKRVYRLPTVAEFEAAARAGGGNAKYPWGDEPPDPKRANYDPSGERTFAEWRTYLRPVKSYPPNAAGIYGLAGNVWQMVDRKPDPATVRFKYRIEHPADLENGLAGGSWARSEYYLQTRVRGGASPGIRHPDIGFRVVRQPEGETHFLTKPRRVVALPQGGSVYIGWRLLAADRADTGFHVYRTNRLDTMGTRITSAPVTTTTDYVDREAPPEGRVYYRVRPVQSDGSEGPPSEWAGVDLAAGPSTLAAVFQPTAQGGGVVPIFGDLDGDGRVDAVLRLDNGIREMSRDPGVPVELEAFTSYGRSLWRRPLVWHDHAFGSANNVPVVVWDLDHDGKSEVIARLQEGDQVYVAVLDGMTGRVRHKTPWADMVTDFAKSSTRIHMAVAYLDGKTPSIVTQTGLYENEVFEAFDPQLNKLWRFESFGETSGSGSHHIDIADIDGDGKDEVFNGTTVVGGDGKMRWSIYREHPDIVAIKRILPGARTRQVFYAVESSVHAGAYLVDAPTGKILWKSNREDDPRWSHAHVGWAADILESSPGMELYTNRDGHNAKETVLFSADGKILLEGFPSGWTPVNWSGGPVRDLMSANGRQIARFEGRSLQPLTGTPAPAAESGSCRMVADLAGDYRDEVVCIGKTAEGAQAVFVYTNTQPATRRELTRTSDREYSLWIARNLGGGYGSYYEWQPATPE